MVLTFTYSEPKRPSWNSKGQSGNHTFTLVVPKGLVTQFNVSRTDGAILDSRRRRQHDANITVALRRTRVVAV